jgi:hypothetical protein
MNLHEAVSVYFLLKPVEFWHFSLVLRRIGRNRVFRGIIHKGGSFCSEMQPPYVVTNKILMFATESRMVRFRFFNIKPHTKTFGGMPLLKLCSLFADTYDGEGE